LVQARVPIDGSEDIALAFTVRNTGRRSGVEVAQLYVRDRHASVVRPVRELEAFQRLVLAPGEAARVQFSVPVDVLQLTDHSGRRVVEPGWFDLMVGPSSACTPLMVQVEVVGAGSRVLPGRWRMESGGDIRKL
jgi:beta-glucosidase